MCSIPLDFERRLEQRWAARFSVVAQEHVEHVEAPRVAAGDEFDRTARWPEFAISPLERQGDAVR